MTGLTQASSSSPTSSPRRWTSTTRVGSWPARNSTSSSPRPSTAQSSSPPRRLNTNWHLTTSTTTRRNLLMESPYRLTIKQPSNLLSVVIDKEITDLQLEAIQIILVNDRMAENVTESHRLDQQH